MLFGHREVVMRCPSAGMGERSLMRRARRASASRRLCPSFGLPSAGKDVIWHGYAWRCAALWATQRATKLCGSRWNHPPRRQLHLPLRAPCGRTGGVPARSQIAWGAFVVVAAGGRGKQGHLVDALAPRGDEGRGTLRKAWGSREQALIPRSPNGATPSSDGGSAAESIGGGGEPGELKHLSTRRKGHQQQSSGLRAGGRDSVSSGERTRTRPVASR